MASVQPRAFTHKLVKRQHPADVQKQMGITSSPLPKSGSSISGFSSLSIASYDITEPLDYEEFLQQHQTVVNRDPLRDVLEFPENDLDVGIIPRTIRTEVNIVPEEDKLSAHVRDCLHCYTSDWVVVSHRYRHHSSSCWVRDRAGECLELVKTLPRQEFEVDHENSNINTPHEEEYAKENGSGMSSRQSLQSVDTPRGSWASFDLRNSVSDPLISGLLQRNPPETIDQLNEVRRQDDRQNSLLLLYPAQEEEEIIERRIPAEIPSEHIGHRILVKCLQMKLELEVEPIFASMAIYDAKERKKISENFYFDMNSDAMKKMLNSHIKIQDISTQSRSCIFDITYPSADLFLVIKLEKVLQGDINECAEPYVKDDKNRDKVRANAVVSCERLGKYRMPFAWTAIYLMNVLHDVNTLERDSGSDKESTGSNSLDRKANSSFEQFRKKASDMGALTRRGSLERRSGEKRRSWSPEDFGSSLDTFRPVTLTVSNFFKQEADKLRDEDLFKFLQDLKRPSVIMKKLKCIPAVLKLDISPCPDEYKYCLTPELVHLHPYPDDMGRPTKEVLEFPSREVFLPHYVYRNLLYIYPKDLNFTNRTGSARNITVKVQLMCGEDELSALPAIFGKSSCPEYTSEYYTSVSYHNKNPDFYDEVKVRLPANLDTNHHLLFTFYHISCQRKTEQPTVETPVGYTWLPLLRDSRLQTGEFSLPVTTDRPPQSYSYIPPDVCLPNMKWVDNHKGIFVVVLDSVSSIHTQDKFLDKFLSLCGAIEDCKIPRGIGESNIESELRKSMLDLTNAKLEPFVKFLPVVLDKLILMIVKPPTIGTQVLNLGQSAFEALGTLVKNVTALQEGHKDQHGRHSLLTTYINYQCTLLNPASSNLLAGFSPPQSPGYMPRPTQLSSPTRYHR
ncbi:hypothetical protein B566_EDAN007893 [Ephemera danica]|nr:hypothetical protein B566_EDAN007893 [Ephemera danica]